MSFGIGSYNKLFDPYLISVTVTIGLVPVLPPAKLLSSTVKSDKSPFNPNCI